MSDQQPRGQQPPYAVPYTPPAYGAPHQPVPNPPPYQQVPPQQYGPSPYAPYGAPPRRKMSRGLLVTLIVVPVVLLLAVGITIGTVGYRTERAIDKAQSETLSTPEEAAGLTLVHSAAIQSQLDRITSTLSGTDLKNPVAGAYGETTSGQTHIVIWGGTGRISALSVNADQFFASAGKSMTFLGPARSSDPGTFGGLLQCRTLLDPTGGGQALCVAIDHGAVLAGLITQSADEQPADLLRAVREDVEHA